MQQRRKIAAEEVDDMNEKSINCYPSNILLLDKIALKPTN